jgi:hypothetical protein
MKPNDWQLRSKTTLDWVGQSILACDGAGSAHSWSWWSGWAKAYPETTGYLLENLVRYHALPEYNNLFPTNQATIQQQVEWLQSIQQPSGAWAGMLVGHHEPSVFNTAQILFGLTEAIEAQVVDYQYVEMLLRACDWLLKVQDEDGAWRQAAYVTGYVPTYYTRAVWGVLRANQLLQDARIQAQMQIALQYYAQKITSDGWCADWGFKPNEAAFTHTIAYTIEGFFESARLLNDVFTMGQAQQMAEALYQRIMDDDGRVAGRYLPDRGGDYSFHCVPGLAQLSTLYSRLGRHFNVQQYTTLGATLLDQVLKYQELRPIVSVSGRRGGLPGSAPIWGAYLRGRYPNWGAKFLLDALWEQHINTNNLR